MNPQSIDCLRHEEIHAWLERALQDREPLPRLTPDEPPYLGVLNLDERVKPATRDSLRSGCLVLLSRFCERGEGEPTYVRELISLATAFSQLETPEWLSDLARRFPQLPALPMGVRFAVLGALVDLKPSRNAHFWRDILRQDPIRHAAMALSGVLTTFALPVIKLLPEMPDDELTGEAAVVNLDLAWEDLPTNKERWEFAQAIQATLPSCRPQFAAPVRAWAESKGAAAIALATNPGLRAALANFLGKESAPRVLTSKLCEVDCLAS